MKDEKDTNQDPPPENKGAKERLYDKIPLSLKQLDIIIIIVIIALIAFFVLGALKGNGVI